MFKIVKQLQAYSVNVVPAGCLGYDGDMLLF